MNVRGLSPRNNNNNNNIYLFAATHSIVQQICVGRYSFWASNNKR